MKNKKSKIIIPAMGLILLSTAASISGSVAWFTANRTATMQATNFAVVNTKDNLEFELGTPNAELIVVNNTPQIKTVSIAAGKSLTDASFDHTDVNCNITVPDAEGKKAEKVIPLANVTYDNNATTGLLKETNVYSAFTWTITFKINFSSSATLKKGIFFDVAKSYAHEVVKLDDSNHNENDPSVVLYNQPDCKAENVATATGGYYAYTAVGDNESATGWKTTSTLDVDVTGDYLVKGQTYYKASYANGTYWKPAPDDTGKAFRLAFVPTNIPASSFGSTRIWAPNQEAAKSKFADGLSVNNNLPAINAGSAYGRADTTNPGTGLVASDEALGESATCLISSADSTLTIPTSATTYTAAKDLKNFIGYAQPGAGTHVDLTFTCVAWYEGTDENIETATTTIYETIATQLEFGTYDLTNE